MPKAAPGGWYQVGLCAVALVVGCSKNGATADSARVASSTEATAAASATGTLAPPPAPPALTDAVILGKLDAANVRDSTAGAMAASKGTNANVNELGRMMLKHHHIMRVDGMTAANKAAVSPETPHDADALAEQAVGDSLTSANRGAAWDKAFIDHAIEGHTRVLLFAQDAANATRNADIKAMIQKATPVVQKHLEKAREIRDKLAATS